MSVLSGNGSSSNPYIITSIKDYFDGPNYIKYYKFADDIIEDASISYPNGIQGSSSSSYNYNPLDGNGAVIKNLYVRDCNYLHSFRKSSGDAGASFKNITFENLLAENVIYGVFSLSASNTHIMNNVNISATLHDARLFSNTADASSYYPGPDVERCGIRVKMFGASGLMYYATNHDSDLWLYDCHITFEGGSLNKSGNTNRYIMGKVHMRDTLIDGEFPDNTWLAFATNSANVARTSIVDASGNNGQVTVTDNVSRSIVINEEKIPNFSIESVRPYLILVNNEEIRDVDFLVSKGFPVVKKPAVIE